MNDLCITLHVEPDEDATLHLDETADLALTMSEQFVIGGGIPYTGAYEADALFREQVFDTKYKKMTDDFTVHAINYTEAPNAYGTTVTIGG